MNKEADHKLNSFRNISCKKYFEKQYGNNHIKSVVDLKDLESLYGLMQEYADEQLRMHIAKIKGMVNTLLIADVGNSEESVYPNCDGYAKETIDEVFGRNTADSIDNSIDNDIDNDINYGQ